MPDSVPSLPVPEPSAALSAAPAWRREPYRVLFPLGLLLTWAGVLHWFLHGLGLLHDYRPVFHSIAQIQGFMMCFAVGFLFTAIPRRTGTGPPAPWQMAVALLAPVGCTVAAWFQAWAWSQACWAAMMLVLIGFAVRRFRSAEASRRPPNSFLWIPLSFLMGLAGAALIALFGVLGPDYFTLHDLGRLLLLQGMFVGLVVGVGGLVFPLITRGQGPPDGTAGPADRRARAGHVAAALVLAASFWVEVYQSLRGGLALRALLVLILLLVSAQLWRPPRVPGWHRWLVWLSAWMIPAGYVLAALFPGAKKAGLHVVFIGGFALMAFSVGLHVTLAHGGHKRLLRGRPWQVPVFGGLLLLAMVFRALVDFDGRRFFPWLAASSGAFLLASVCWAVLVFPRLWREGGET
ncbi:MAG: NnrS family protein [Dehalococcoidia bacterium]